MQDRTTICRQTGCGLPVTNAAYCSAHVRDNDTTKYDKVRAKDSTRKMYWSARYRRFRDFLWVRNPTCQKINNGVRCTQPSNVLHHLVSPEDAPALFLTASNAVMLCPGCHPGGEAGTPHWKVNVHYAPTFAGYGFLGDSNPNL
jgi:5-methylcytosine-specific restriction endonuclease McrA